MFSPPKIGTFNHTFKMDYDGKAFLPQNIEKEEGHTGLNFGMISDEREKPDSSDSHLTNDDDVSH